MTTKHCPQCDRDLPELFFSACHKNPDGLAKICRHCDADRQARYRVKRKFHGARVHHWTLAQDAAL